MPMTALPPLDRAATTFRTDVDTFFGSKLPTFVTEANTLETNVVAKESSAATSATNANTKAGEAATSASNAANQVTLAANQVTLATDQVTQATAQKTAAANSAAQSAQSAALPGWVSGTNYTLGQRAISLLSGRAYLVLTAGVSSVDPLNDPGRWQLITSNNPVVVVTATAATAQQGNHYVMTNAALTTLTLPASPATGAVVQATFANGRGDNVIARNGSGLMVTLAGVPILEDMVYDAPATSITLEFSNNAWRFKTENAAVASSLLYGQAPVVTHAGATLVAANAAAGKYTRFTSAAAKTYSFDSAQAYTIGAEFPGRNSATGDLTLTAVGGFILNAPLGGTLVIPLGGTFGVKIVAAGEADVYGVTT